MWYGVLYVCGLYGVWYVCGCVCVVCMCVLCVVSGVFVVCVYGGRLCVWFVWGYVGGGAVVWCFVFVYGACVCILCI